MKRSLAIMAGLTIVTVSGFFAFAFEETRDPNYDYATAGGHHYKIPKVYGDGGFGGDGLGFPVSYPDFGPLLEDKPGWDDHALLLVTTQVNTIAQLWNSLWDGTPRGEMTPWDEIKRTYRIEPEFTVQVTGSQYDTIIPDQDRKTFPLGVMRCVRAEDYPYPGCEYMFDRNGQRWKISFGRQFLSDYKQIRDKATRLVDSFEEEEEH